MGIACGFTSEPMARPASTAARARVLWTNRELKIDHKEGPGSSPIIVGDLLIVNCDGTDFQYIVALDKRTGHTGVENGTQRTQKSEHRFP